MEEVTAELRTAGGGALGVLGAPGVASAVCCTAVEARAGSPDSAAGDVTGAGTSVTAVAVADAVGARTAEVEPAAGAEPPGRAPAAGGPGPARTPAGAAPGHRTAAWSEAHPEPGTRAAPGAAGRGEAGCGGSRPGEGGRGRPAGPVGADRQDGSRKRSALGRMWAQKAATYGQLRNDRPEGGSTYASGDVTRPRDRRSGSQSLIRSRNMLHEIAPRVQLQPQETKSQLQGLAWDAAASRV